MLETPKEPNPSGEEHIDPQCAAGEKDLENELRIIKGRMTKGPVLRLSDTADFRRTPDLALTRHP